MSGECAARLLVAAAGARQIAVVTHPQVTMSVRAAVPRLMITRRDLLHALAVAAPSGAAGALLNACRRAAGSLTPERRMEQVRSRDGTQIAVWRSGEGRPLLLVHGTTANHARWDRILPELERDHTVFAMDRRGRGGSGDGPSYAMALEAEDVAAVLETIARSGGEPADVLGHSYGAICALESLRHTPTVRRVVLYEPPISGGPLYPPGVPERMRAQLDAGQREEALLLFFREVVRMPEEELRTYRALPAWQHRITLAHTIPRELQMETHYAFEPNAFREVQVPVLLLAGGDSPPSMREGAETLHAVLPNSRLVELPGQQHVAMDTAPELFLGVVREFLE